MLASGVPYEFKILAVNEMGRGPWSGITMPLLTLSPKKSVKMPSLVYLRTLGQVLELRETIEMSAVDEQAVVSTDFLLVYVLALVSYFILTFNIFYLNTHAHTFYIFIHIYIFRLNFHA